MDEVLTGLSLYTIDLVKVVGAIFLVLVIAGAIYQRKKRK